METITSETLTNTKFDNVVKTVKFRVRENGDKGYFDKRDLSKDPTELKTQLILKDGKEQTNKNGQVYAYECPSFIVNCEIDFTDVDLNRVLNKAVAQIVIDLQKIRAQGTEVLRDLSKNGMKVLFKDMKEGRAPADPTSKARSAIGKIDDAAQLEAVIAAAEAKLKAVKK